MVDLLSYFALADPKIKKLERRTISDLAYTYFVDTGGDDESSGDNITRCFATIGKAISEVGTDQGNVIQVSAGSYSESLSITESTNLVICAQDSPVDSRITEITGGFTLSGVHRVRLSHLQIQGASLIDSSQGSHYFQNVGFVGGLTISDIGVGFIVITDSFINSLTIDTGFLGVAYFVRCTFEGSSVTLNNAVSAQVIMYDCAGFPGASFPLNALYGGTNSLQTGVSRSDSSYQYLGLANETTTMDDHKILLRNETSGAIESFDVNELFTNEVLVHGYQDFTATAVNLTLTEFQNATTPITGGDFEPGDIISGSAVVTLSSDSAKVPYTTLLVLLSKVVSATNVGADVTLSAVPKVADQDVRVWYKYKMKIKDIPDGYSESPKFINQKWLDTIDEIFATDEDVGRKQDKKWYSLSDTSASHYEQDGIVNHAGELYLNKTGDNTDTSPNNDPTNWRIFAWNPEYASYDLTTNEAVSIGGYIKNWGEVSIEPQKNSFSIESTGISGFTVGAVYECQFYPVITTSSASQGYCLWRFSFGGGSVLGNVVRTITHVETTRKESSVACYPFIFTGTATGWLRVLCTNRYGTLNTDSKLLIRRIG